MGCMSKPTKHDCRLSLLDSISHPHIKGLIVLTSPLKTLKYTNPTSQPNKAKNSGCTVVEDASEMDRLNLEPKPDRGCLMPPASIPSHLVMTIASPRLCCTYPEALFQFSNQINLLAIKYGQEC